MSATIVGLTGGIGSGKSTVAALFAERGAAVVDTDAIAHHLTSAGGGALPAIAQTFGARFITAGGALDRPALRQLVFADARERARLEALLHPLIAAEAQRECQAALAGGAPYVLLVVPLLVETGGRQRYGMQRVLLVDCAVETQIARTMARSGLTRAEVEAIIAAQACRAARQAIADDIIDNDGALVGLTLAVDRLHRTYRELP